MRYLEVFKEDCGVPANAVSGGGVDGIGVGDKGEPGVQPPKRKRRTVLRGILSGKGGLDDGR